MSSLFDKFSSAENLKKAFLYLTDELKNSTLALDPIWTPMVSAIAQLGDGFFDTLQAYIRKDFYKPTAADFFYADKDNLGVRPVCILSVIDRIIFQAILNPLILGNIIDQTLISSCYGNRISNKSPYLNPYKKQWISFCNRQIDAFNQGLHWRTEFDIQTFYENVHPDILLEILAESFRVKDGSLLKILETQLKTWAENQAKCGIPQGPNASHVLANAYLYPLDIFIDNLCRTNKFGYFRYADDIVIMAKSAEATEHIVKQIAIFLRKYNLKLNEKTKTQRLNNPKTIEELKFYNPYGTLNETSKQKVERIEKRIPNILRKITRSNFVSKKDMSAIRYYLKADHNKNPERLADFISIISKKPSLIVLISRYLGTWFSGGNTEITPNVYEKVWQIYKRSDLSDWVKFWLVKLLCIPKIAISHKELRTEIGNIVADPNANFLRPSAFFYEAYIRDMVRWENAMNGKDIGSIQPGFTIDDIKRHIRNAKTETEKAVYYYFIIYIAKAEEDSWLHNIIHDALGSESPEVQTMGIFLTEKLYEIPLPELARIYNGKPINKQAIEFEMKIDDYKKLWNIDLDDHYLGDLSKIYFRIPSQDKEESTRRQSKLDVDGKIPLNQLGHFFGVTGPIEVKLAKGSEIKIEGLTQQKVSQKLKNKHTIDLIFPEPVHWEKVLLKVQDGAQDIEIYYNNKHIKTASYIDLGFSATKKNHRPDRQWVLLTILAVLQSTDITQATPSNLLPMIGKYSDKNIKIGNVHQAKRGLSTALQAIFNTEDDPFHDNKEYYEPKFKILPQPMMRDNTWEQGGRLNENREYIDIN